MLFNTYTFILFLVAVFAVHRALPSWIAQKRLLWIASYVFYAAWNPPFVLLLLFSTVVDWWVARWISRTEVDWQRRALLALSLCSNLGLLGFFKYGSFLLDNFVVLAAGVGVDFAPPGLDIVLPVGISFYTFQSLSYTIDVYRRRFDSHWSFSDFALYVSFFPQLVAGPIVRASAFLPQLSTPKRASGSQLGWGASLLVFGLFQKVVLADALLAPVVDVVYATPEAYGALDTWVAVLAFSGQIFFDFSGYSLCAVGVALCLGFVLPDNFRYPYAATGFSDFWRRWHISLSTWLRDYIYVPIGGSRNGHWQTYRNLAVTMLIGGLWHGASWMFVLWGALHGLFLAIERWWRERRTKAPPNPAAALFAMGTFLAITLAWIPFRADSMSTAWTVFAGLFRFEGPVALTLFEIAGVVGVMLVTLRWHWLMRDGGRAPREFARLSSDAKAILIGLCLIALFMFSGGDERAFFYFQF